MPFEVRDNDRYGSYPVTVEGNGDCQFIMTGMRMPHEIF